MRLLSAKCLEPVVRHDVLGAEVLELRAVGAGLLGQGHEMQRAIKAAVVVGRDVGNEVRGLGRANEAAADVEGRHSGIVGARRAPLRASQRYAARRMSVVMASPRAALRSSLLVGASGSAAT